MREEIQTSFKSAVKAKKAMDDDKVITLSQKTVDNLVTGLSSRLKQAVEENHSLMREADKHLNMLHDEEWEYIVADAYILELPVLPTQVHKKAKNGRTSNTANSL